jgi:hypothetical protein
MNDTRRHDLYAFIHKGLRAFLSHTLVRVGRLDPHDPADVAEAMEEVRALMDICEGHLAHENAFVHLAMEARRPGSTAAVAADHDDHVRAIANLRAMTHLVPGSDEAAHALYHALSAFVAHNLEHMGVEETANNAVLWATHTDAELLGIQHAIQAHLPPAEMQLALRWMLPHVSPSERAAMLGGMRASAPPAVFDQVVALVRPLLGGRDWRKLSIALGL